MIASVVGNSEAVIKTSDLDLFRRLMKFVSVTASMLVSQSTTAETATTGPEIVELAKKEGDVPETVTIDIPEDEYNPEPEPPAGGDSWGDDEEW